MVSEMAGIAEITLGLKIGHYRIDVKKVARLVGKLLDSSCYIVDSCES